LAIGLGIAVGAWAQEPGRNPASRDQERGWDGRQTIRGKVAAVALAGETIVNHETNQAMVAQAAFVTIVGRQVTSRTGSDSKGEVGSARANRDEQARDTDRANRDSGQSRETARHDRDDGMRQRHRGNIYVLAVTPRTSIYEGEGGNREQAANPAATPSRGGIPAGFDRLEIGDEVEVVAQRSDQAARPNLDRRHGRHRIVRGEAVSVTILSAPGQPIPVTNPPTENRNTGTESRPTAKD
jgi:hypothetical protein